jgi:hypothetical protein
MDEMMKSLTGGGSEMEGLDMSALMSQAFTMAKSLSSDVNEDEKEEFQNMNSEDAIKNITGRVMKMMSGMNDSATIEELEDANPDDITVTLDVTVADIVKGLHNRKIKYKRSDESNKIVKCKAFVSTEPMTLQNVVILQNKGHREKGNLHVKLNVKQTNTLRLDNNNNLCVKWDTVPETKTHTISIVGGLEVELESEDLRSTVYVLKNKGLLVGETRTDLVVECKRD